MSSPTPGSDPNYPQGAAPQGQPGWVINEIFTVV